MFYGFAGSGFGDYANWSQDDCPYNTAYNTSKGEQYCCYPGNSQPECSSTVSSSGGSSTSSGGGSTSATVGTGVGAGIGALLNKLLAPSPGACPPGFMMGPNNVCIPMAQQQPWYTTPAGLIGLGVAGLIAYKLISG